MSNKSDTNRICEKRQVTYTDPCTSRGCDFRNACLAQCVCTRIGNNCTVSCASRDLAVFDSLLHNMRLHTCREQRELRLKSRENEGGSHCTNAACPDVVCSTMYGTATPDQTHHEEIYITANFYYKIS